MTDLPRNQHIVASGLIAAVGISIAYISFTQEPADAFIFPRLISSVFAVLAIWTFVQYAARIDRYDHLRLLGSQGVRVLYRDGDCLFHLTFTLRSGRAFRNEKLVQTALDYRWFHGGHVRSSSSEPQRRQS